MIVGGLLRARRLRPHARHRRAARVGERHPRRARRLAWTPRVPPDGRHVASAGGRVGHDPGRALRQRARLRRPRRAARPVDRRPGLVLGRRRRPPRHPVRDALRARCSTTPPASRGRRWFTGGRTNLADACVDRWADEHPRRRGRSCGRARRAPPARGPTPQLRAEADGLAAPARAPRRHRRRHRRHLPADAPGDGRRRDGGGQARRRVRPGVLRLRRRGRAGAPRGRRRQGAHHRRRLPAARQAGADARHRARGRRRHADDRRRRPAGHGRRLRRPGPAVAAAGQPRRSRRGPSTASTRCSSPTRRARPAGPRASCTSTAAGR